jgi:hypothetical protein
VDVRQQILCIFGERARQAAKELVYRTVAAHLTRQPALKADPLPVNVLVALEFSAVTLDAGERLDLDNVFGH